MDPIARPPLRDRSAFGAAFFLSAFGYETLFFAMTLRVYDITGKAINVGMLAGILLLPQLFSPLYGFVVDRLGSRRMLAFASGLIGILALGLSFCERLESIYVLWFLLSILFVASSNSRTVMMTMISSSDGFVGGNTAVFVFLNSAKLLAPFLAGMLASEVGSRWLIRYASPIYFACAICSLLVAENRAGAVSTVSDGYGRLFTSLKEGFKIIGKSKRLKSLVELSAIRNSLLGFAPNLLIVVIIARLGGTNTEYGLAVSALSLGGLVGCLAGLMVGRRGHRSFAVVLGLGLHFASYAALGLLASFHAALLVLVIGGFSLNVTAVLVHSMRDAETEASTRGRVYGANTAIQTLPSLVSTFAFGALADHLDIGVVYFVAGSTALLSLGLAAKGLRKDAGKAVK